jgi:hypothetical protein
MDNMILGAEKLKTEIYQRNAEQFQKASNVPPEFVLADSAQKTQMGLINAFNQKWGKAFQQSGGNLSDEQKMQMTTDKNVLLMQQQQMQSSMVRAMKDREDVQKDVQGNLDHEDFNNRWNDYLKTGNYDQSPLLPASISPNDYFNKDANKFKGNPADVTTVENIGGVPQKVTRTASGTEAQGRTWVQDRLHNDDRFARGVIQDFQNLKNTNPSLYKQYLDTDINGTVSPDGARASQSVNSNPILKYAQDNYWQNALKLGESKPVTLKMGSATKFDYSKVNATNNQNGLYTPQDGFAAKDATGKVFNLPSYQDLGQKKVVTVDQNIKQIYTKDKNGNETLVPFNQSAKFDITGYSKDKDQILITLDSGTTGDGDYSKGDQLVVPAADFDDVLKNKYGIFRGQQTTTATTNSILERAKQLNSKPSKK